MSASAKFWSAVYRKLVKHLSECCRSVAQVSRTSRSGALENVKSSNREMLIRWKELRRDVAKQEQFALAREIVAAREIAHHCRLNNYIYNQLQELANHDIANNGKLSFIQRVFIEHRYIFEAIAKRIHVIDPLIEVKINPTINQLPLSKANATPCILRHYVEHMLYEDYHGCPRIYTDASKSPSGSCGIGVYDESHNVRISLQLRLDTSIMTAETLAIKVAMQHICHQNVHNVVLLTDSQAACAFLKKNKLSRFRNSVANEILEIARLYRVSVQWVPGHISLTGNDIADQLSRDALSTDALLENNIFVNDAITYFEERQATRINKWYQEYVKLKSKSLKQLFDEEDIVSPYCYA